jgi:hypothetical protein
MSGSNLGRHTDYPDWGVRWFSSVTPDKRYILWRTHYSTSFPVTPIEWLVVMCSELRRCVAYQSKNKLEQRPLLVLLQSRFFVFIISTWSLPFVLPSTKSTLWHDTWTPEMCNQRSTAETPIARQRLTRHVSAETERLVETKALLRN